MHCMKIHILGSVLFFISLWTVDLSQQLAFAIHQQERPQIVYKLGPHINTAASEYLPILHPSGEELYFTAMDRTGFFDFKLNFTEQSNAGGEDIFYSKLENGVWRDARPVTFLNTNRHEAVTQVKEDGSLVLTANYDEKLGPRSNPNLVETTDLFYARKSGNEYKIEHYPEPLNSIFNEADGWMDEQQGYFLFVSDRPGHVGDYKQKGWKWRNSFWGNTDVYVSLFQNYRWSKPIHLGQQVNSFGAERTPWLSNDGRTLFVSSNGYEDGKEDLDIYSFTRDDVNDWTNWKGPFKVGKVNTNLDDWGYKENADGYGYFSRAQDIGFERTQRGYNGDGGIKEINFRTGYAIYGAQLASLSATEDTEIFVSHPEDKPSIQLPDVLFEFDSHVLSGEAESLMQRVVYLCKSNAGSLIKIEGHTDNTGSDDYNQGLSEKRAEAVATYLKKNGIREEILTSGRGSKDPRASNETETGRSQNRRVEIQFAVSNAN